MFQWTTVSAIEIDWVTIHKESMTSQMMILTCCLAFQASPLFVLSIQKLKFTKHVYINIWIHTIN